MSDCAEVQGQFSELFDGELSEPQRQRIEEHFSICGLCREEFDSYRNSLTALKTTGPIEIGEQFETTVSIAMAQEADKDAFQRQARITRRSAESRFVYRTPGWIPIAAAAGLAAMFLLGFLLARPQENTELQSLQELISKLNGKIEGMETELQRRPDGPDPVLTAQVSELRKGKEALEKQIEELNFRLGSQPTEEDKKKWLETVQGLRERVDGLEKKRDELLAKIEEMPVNPDVDREALVREWMKKEGLVEFEGRYVHKDTRDDILAGRVLRNPALVGVDNAVTKLLDGLEIGGRQPFENLTLYPILTDNPVRNVSFTSLHTAMTDPKFEVIDEGNPFQLKIRNYTESDVFVLAGELFVGGRTTRVAARDMVIPKKKTSEVGVLCAEPGAWRRGDGTQKMKAESGFYFATMGIRRAMIVGAGQGVLWSEITRTVGPEGILPYYEGKADEIARYRIRFADLLDNPRIIGVAVAVGDRIRFAEIFGNNEIFNQYYERILAAGVLEALAWKPGKSKGAVRPSRADVRRFVQNAFYAKYTGENDGSLLSENGRNYGLSFHPGDTPLRTVLYSSEPVSLRLVKINVPEDKVRRVVDEYTNQYRTVGQANRIAILRDVRTIPSPRSVQLIRRAAKLTEDLSVRREAISALSYRARDLQPKDQEVLVQELNGMLRSHQKNKVLFKTTAITLSKIGHEKAVTPFLSFLGSDDRDQVEIISEAMPVLLLQVKNKSLLERAVGEIISLHEKIQDVLQDRRVTGPLAGLTKDDYKVLGPKIEKSLQSVTGKAFEVAAGYRKWWQDSSAKSDYLKERTGK